MPSPTRPTWLALLAIVQLAWTKSCPPVSSSFNINVQNLYPESAAWDPVTCRLYLSSIYNATLVAFNPYTHTSEIIPLPGISTFHPTNSIAYHANGIDYDAVSGEIYIAAAAATAFESTMSGDYSHANFTGPNRVLRYDPVREVFNGDIDLAPAQKEFQARNGDKRTSGFQDMAEDLQGNSYVIGTFGNSILKICRGSERAELWYAPEHYNATYGFGGIFSVGDTLVVSDTLSGGLVTFNARKEVPEPHYVPLQGLPQDYRPLMADGLFAPGKYGGKIALWSDDYNGTSVYGSHDGWKSAHFLGLVENEELTAEGGFTVASFDIGERLFVVTEFFQVNLPPQPKASWSTVDITAAVDGIIERAGFGEGKALSS
ncbi:hypothetical protein M409DRAFT_54253 [Zasmidium cellare ATCC 36951]|uniref:SMP-30/Gluconolactonase/LRE-like region domain-containing protein n=1 Tax=Zasmidium cellare ATCC 36951 TaxID=1080233 RepID=A0A6A6CMR8_ZASCE|nr:uncharacterized protein M409DRAFT_54253 [Zasmidium cellare ATCC 36951]KAF2167039.1 hypothetical protein M409DRAFT_54253 [Zasmidium cellare ATCC 36951]